MLRSLFFFSILALSLLCRAEGPQCINGSPTKMQFVNQLRHAKAKAGTPLAYYRESKHLNKKELSRYDLKIDAGFSSKEKLCSVNSSAMSKIFKGIIGNIKLGQIKEQCIEASLKRNNSVAAGYYCESPHEKPIPVGGPGPKGPCIDSEITKYLTFIFNRAMECLSTPERPLDPLLMFKVFNNESGFSFFQRNEKHLKNKKVIVGGTGLGQLVNIAIRDVNKPGRSDIFQTIKNSKHPSCAVFKDIMKEKLRSSGQVCGLTELTQGVAKNLLYSLGLFKIRRDLDLIPFDDRMKAMGIPEDIRFHRRNTLAVLSYGPEGLKEMKDQAALLDKKTILDPGKFQQFIEKSAYLTTTRTRYEEQIASPLNLSNNLACLEQ